LGEGDDRDIAMSSHHQRFRPSTERGVALRHMGQRRARSVDQLLAQVLVAALADPEQLRLSAGGEPPRRMELPDATVLVLQGLIFVILLTSETLYGRFSVFRQASAKDRT
jgi:hypothetical protein